MQIFALIAMALSAALAGSLITVMYYRVKIANIKTLHNEALVLAGELGWKHGVEIGAGGRHRAPSKLAEKFTLAK